MTAMTSGDLAKDVLEADEQEGKKLCFIICHSGENEWSEIEKDLKKNLTRTNTSIAFGASIFVSN